MNGNPDFEKSVTGWSAVVICVGLLLIAAQLGMQLLIDYRLPAADQATAVRAAGGLSSYIGMVVLLVGAILMALVVLTSRRRADPGPAVESRLGNLEAAANDCNGRIERMETTAQDQGQRIEALANWAATSGFTIVRIEESR
jgi:hypothetical protein